MQNLAWKTASEEELIKRLGAHGGKDNAARVSAFSRASRAHEFKKTRITVAVGASLVLPCFRPEPGVSMVEINAGAGARLSLEYLHGANAPAASMLILDITVEDGASLDSFFGFLGSSDAGLITETKMKGKKSSLKERTIFFGGNTQSFDIFSRVILSGAGAAAKVESRGILTDSSQARFDGSIVINESARGARAMLNEHTLLLSSDCKINAIPGLTIETNDVLATHSASMTRIDNEQLFYLLSRGMEEKSAKRLIAKGFLGQLMQGETDENAKEINELLKAKICRI